MRKLFIFLCLGVSTATIWANPSVIEITPQQKILLHKVVTKSLNDPCFMCMGISAYAHQALRDRPIFGKPLLSPPEGTSVLEQMGYFVDHDAKSSFIYFDNIQSPVIPKDDISEAKKIDQLVLDKMKKTKSNYGFITIAIETDYTSRGRGIEIEGHSIFVVGNQKTGNVVYIDQSQSAVGKTRIDYKKGFDKYLSGRKRKFRLEKNWELLEVYFETSHLKVPKGRALYQDLSEETQRFKSVDIRKVPEYQRNKPLSEPAKKYKYRNYDDFFQLDPNQGDIEFSGKRNRFSRWKKQLSVIPKDDIELLSTDKLFKRSTDVLSRPLLSGKRYTSLPKMGASVGKNLKGLKAMKALRLATKSARFMSKFTGPADLMFFAVDTGFYAVDMSNISRRDDLSSSEKGLRYAEATIMWLNPIVALLQATAPNDGEFQAYKKLVGVQSSALSALKSNGYDYSILETKLNENSVQTALKDADISGEAFLIDSNGKSSEEASRHLAWATRFGLVDQAAVVADTSYLNLNYQMYERHKRLFPALSLLAKAYEQDMFNTIKAGLSGVSQQVAYCVFNAILILNEDIEEPRDFRKSCASGFSDSEIRETLLAMFTSAKRQELLNLHAEYLQQRKELLDQVYPDEVEEFYTKTTDEVLQNIDSDGVHKAYQEAYRSSGGEILKARLWSGMQFGTREEKYDCKSVKSSTGGYTTQICSYRTVDGYLPEVSASNYDASLDHAVKTQYNDDFSTLKSEIRTFLNDHYIPYLTRQSPALNAGLPEFPDWYNQKVSEYTVSQPIEWDCEHPITTDANSQFGSSVGKGWRCTASKHKDIKYFSLSSTKKPVFPADFQGLWLEKYLKTLLENKENYDEYEFASMTGDPKFFETYLKPQIDDECFDEDKCLSKLAHHVFEMEEDAKYSNDFFYTSFRNYYVWKNYGNHLYQRDAYDLPYLRIRSVADQSQCVDASLAVVDCMSGNTRFLYKMVSNKVQIQHPQGGCVLVESDALKQGSCESQQGWSNASSGASYEGKSLTDAVSLSLQGSTLLTAIPNFSTSADGLVKLGDSTDALSSLFQSLLYQAKNLPDTVKRLNLVSKLTNSQQLAFAGGKCVNADISDLSVSLATCANSSTQWWHGPDQLLKVEHLQNQKPEYCLSNTNNSLNLKECQ